KQRQVRQGGADSERVDGPNRFRVEPPRHALVDSGGIEKTITEHNFVFCQRRGNDFAHKLRATGGKKKELSLRRKFLALVRKLQQSTDFFADCGAARLAGGHNWCAGLAQAVRQAAELRGLATALRAFKSDENSGHDARGLKVVR